MIELVAYCIEVVKEELAHLLQILAKKSYVVDSHMWHCEEASEPMRVREAVIWLIKQIGDYVCGIRSVSCLYNA